MNIYIVNGFPRSGKDTFVHYCTRNLNFNLKRVFSLSTVTPIKSMLYQCGWKGEKTPNIRKLISEVKNLLSENNFVNEYVENFINATKNDKREENVIFIFSREPEEISYLKNKYKAKTIFVKRNSVNFIDMSNDSDKNVENFDYDYYIDNNGTFEELNNQVRDFLKEENLI